MIKSVIVLLIIWAVLSGYFKSFFIISGLISSIVIVFLLIYKRIPIYNLSIQSFKYGLWLFYQMIISSWNVTKLVWKKKLIHSPQIKKITCNKYSHVLTTILANSITLTPGTITIHEEDGHLYVHALMEEYLEGIEDIKQQINLVTKNK